MDEVNYINSRIRKTSVDSDRVNTNHLKAVNVNAGTINSEKLYVNGMNVEAELFGLLGADIIPNPNTEDLKIMQNTDAADEYVYVGTGDIFIGQIKYDVRVSEGSNVWVNIDGKDRIKVTLTPPGMLYSYYPNTHYIAYIMININKHITVWYSGLKPYNEPDLSDLPVEFADPVDKADNYCLGVVYLKYNNYSTLEDNKQIFPQMVGTGYGKTIDKIIVGDNINEPTEFSYDVNLNFNNFLAINSKVYNSTEDQSIKINCYRNFIGYNINNKGLDAGINETLLSRNLTFWFGNPSPNYNLNFKYYNYGSNDNVDTLLKGTPIYDNNHARITFAYKGKTGNDGLNLNVNARNNIYLFGVCTFNGGKGAHFETSTDADISTDGATLKGFSQFVLSRTDTDPNYASVFYTGIGGGLGGAAGNVELKAKNVYLSECSSLSANGGDGGKGGGFNGSTANFVYQTIYYDFNEVVSFIGGRGGEPRSGGYIKISYFDNYTQPPHMYADPGVKGDDGTITITNSIKFIANGKLDATANSFTVVSGTITESEL